MESSHSLERPIEHATCTRSADSSGHSVKSSWHYTRSLAVIRQAHPSEMGKRNNHHLCETAEASGGACTYSARLRGCTRKPGKRYSCTCIRCSVIQVTQPRQILQTEADHCPKQDPVTSNLRVTTVTNLALPPPTSGAARMDSFKIISASAAMVRARHGPAEMGIGVASRQPSAHWLRVSGSTYASPKNDLL